MILNKLITSNEDIILHTGTQVLLLVVSETGLVYTFTASKLQPLVTQPEGKNLIQACLNAPTAPFLPQCQSVPVGRASAPMSLPSSPGSTNLPVGLTIPGGPVGGPQSATKENGDEEVTRGNPAATAGDKRCRRPWAWSWRSRITTATSL
ncbi:hypothetical protein DFH29DRAFT_802199 [Suillus ampliporus]|nr:hypothetical protein DFH29DRAFT_802199 [Suillus ampliporus]